MSNRIITISRQFGSGGRTVGKEVAAKLGIPCYDADLIDKISEQSGFTKEYVAERGEYGVSSNWFERAFNDRDRNGHSFQDDLWRVQQQVILDLAQKGSCVIVGRCADYILKDKPNCYSFFIYADDDFRAQRAKTDYNGATLDQLNKEEKRRKQYYEFYTGQTWGAPEHYDLMINTSNMALEDAADFILDYIKKNPRG